MAQIIADVMTRDPATVERRESTWAAARRVAAAEAGDVIGLDHRTVCRIPTEEDSGCALTDVSAAEGNT